MSQVSDKEEFLKLIHHLAEAAECTRKLAFLRGQKEWLAVDTLILQVRKNVIALAEAKERQGLIQ